jgi:beta-N-acetylhexosaminidase
MVKKVWFCWLLMLIPAFSVLAQSKKAQWVDSVFSTLDVSAKIGQLLMVSVNSYEEADKSKVDNLIKNFKIGGVVFTKGGPVTQAKLTQQFQQQTEVPLLVGIHAEEGLGSVLDSTMQFVPPIMLGSLRHDSLLFFMGEEIGRQLKALGVHINFGPTANLSTAFDNEALLTSAYGSDKYRVANKIVTLQAGLKKNGILTVAKYYPDRGLRVQGFQKGIPVLQTREEPDKLFLLQKLFENGCSGVITSYNYDPIFPVRKKSRLTSKQKIASATVPSLYSAEYLRRQLNFKGLSFSSITDIKLLNKRFRAGDAELFSLKAGNDVLLFSENLNATVRKIRKAVKKDQQLESRLNESVKKILDAKFDAGLSKPTQISVDDLSTHLNTTYANELNSVIQQKSITVVKDENQLLPIKNLENKKFASLAIGSSKENTFNFYLNKYVPFASYQLQIAEDTARLLNKLNQYDVVVVGIFEYAQSIESIYPQLLPQVDSNTQLIVVVMASPSKISLLDKLPTLVQAFTDNTSIQKLLPQILFGADKADGILPITITESIKFGAGISTVPVKRLGYAQAEAVGMDSNILEKIATIAREAIDQKATPGCQIIVARKGKIVYEHSMGWQTYDNQIPINDQSIYDLASITKVAATLPTTMFLYERGLFDLYKKASVYLPELKTSNKKDVTIKDILTHQAGLTPFIPFWTQTLKDSDFLPQYYSKSKSDNYSLQVAPNLFGVQSLRDSLWTWSIKSKLRDKVARTPYNYVYSDVGLYILHHLNEKLLNQPQEDFLHQNFYEPLGAFTMGYLPLERFDKSRIVPTENDKLFRKELLLGTVHDEGAAMLGGIAGHAGLFGTALDLAKLGQMMLQRGYYGGYQFFKPETVDFFTAKQFESSRRGLGWDKPVQSEWISPTSVLASPKTYGHTGFTGTCIWIDPEFELVYVFLSNRVYPDRSNNKLSSTNIRSRIQDVIYQSIFSYSQYGQTQNALERYLQTSNSINP